MHWPPPTILVVTAALAAPLACTEPAPEPIKLSPSVATAAGTPPRTAGTVPVEAGPTGPAGVAAEVPGIAGSAAAPKAPPLTPEELSLIAADPKDLTREQRRARSYALRKKIMQNPNSPTAIALEDARRAIEAGQLQVPDHLKTAPDTGLTLHQKPEILEAGRERMAERDAPGDG